MDPQQSSLRARAYSTLKHREQEVEFLEGSLGLYGDNGKENGKYYIVYRGYVGIVEKKMETTIIYRVIYPKP